MNTRCDSSYASSAGSTPTGPGPIASTCALGTSASTPTNYLVATTRHDFNASTSHALPKPPVVPYQSMNLSDLTATLVDPLPLPLAPVQARRYPACAPVALLLESTDSYFTYFAYAEAGLSRPDSPAALHSTWSSSSLSSSVKSRSSSDSLELLHSPSDQPLVDNDYCFPPDVYESYLSVGPQVDGLAGGAYYSLPPAGSVGLEAEVNFAGLGLGFTPGGKT